MIDKFRRLLYDISKQLSVEEVNELVYLCKVPHSAQTRIQDGKDLFRHLEESGVINEHKIHELKKVLNLLRPKRQDLLDLVDKKFPVDDGVRSDRSISICTTNTINTITSGTSGYSSVVKANCRPGELVRQNTRDDDVTPPPKTYFIVDCYCMQFHGCSITKPFCCCHGMTVFLFFLLMISVIFWFSGKPKTVYTYLNANEYRKDVGFIVVGALSFLLMIVILPYLVRKRGSQILSWCNQKRNEHVQRRRSLRYERQLLQESQAISQYQSESSPSRNTTVEMNKVNQIPVKEAQKSGNEVQTI